MKYFLIAVLTFAWGITAGYGAPPLVTPMANPPSPALTSPENWTMVVVGDTQCYTFCRRNLSWHTAPFNQFEFVIE
ncbi:MAG: hypothetical protein IKD46_09520 [Lentisphaeria bacterium]|nr:hypothetical protein [Lentisphaeria bacterium]